MHGEVEPAEQHGGDREGQEPGEPQHCLGGPAALPQPDHGAGAYFLPWFFTASMAAAAASGSRYRPPVVTGRRSSSSSYSSGMPVGMFSPAMSASEMPSRCFTRAVSYTHLRAHETVLDLVCRLLLEKK